MRSRWKNKDKRSGRSRLFANDTAVWLLLPQREPPLLTTVFGVHARNSAFEHAPGMSRTCRAPNQFARFSKWALVCPLAFRFFNDTCRSGRIHNRPDCSDQGSALHNPSGSSSGQHRLGIAQPCLGGLLTQVLASLICYCAP